MKVAAYPADVTNNPELTYFVHLCDFPYRHTLSINTEVCLYTGLQSIKVIAITYKRLGQLLPHRAEGVKR